MKHRSEYLEYYWGAYNGVRHDRVANYTQRTFGSLLDALSGLYMVDLLYVKKIGDFWLADPRFAKTEESRDVPNDVSRLFQLEKWATRQRVFARNSYRAAAEDIDELFV